jgi:hypothetical protein
MPVDEAFEALPALYAGWMAALLPSGIPRERKATCEACAMCAPKGAAASPADAEDGAEYFDAATKCCTYAPNLPNFLVGAILADDSAAARGRVLERLAAREAVTPLGVARPTAYGVLFDAADDAFGRARGLTCPYYVADGGRCGAWRHRESVCATWFCKHERGRRGFGFWREALQRLLGELEDALAKWCVLQLEPGEAALDTLIASPEWRGGETPLTPWALDRTARAKDYDRLWGRWVGREAEFFARCAELAAGLAWPDVLALAGAEGAALAAATRRAFRRLTDPAAPQRPRAAPYQVVKAGADTTRVVTYSPYDPLDVPSLALALLPAFDGRPTAAALAEIETRTGVRLEPDLVRRLADFGLLTDASAEPG